MAAEIVRNQKKKEDKDNKEEEEEVDDKVKDVVWFIGAWVTRPERPKGAKNEVKDPRLVVDNIFIVKNFDLSSSSRDLTSPTANWLQDTRRYWRQSQEHWWNLW